MAGQTFSTTFPFSGLTAGISALVADSYDHVLRVGDRDVRGLPGVIVVREAVLLAVDVVLVPELGVVVGRSGQVEVGRVGLRSGRELRDVPVEPGAQCRIIGQGAAAAEDLRGGVGRVTIGRRIGAEVVRVGTAGLERRVVAG